MDIYLNNVPSTAHQFVHPQDKVGPIWTGQLVRVNPIQVDAEQFRGVGRQQG